jgi:hypothetical protein
MVYKQAWSIKNYRYVWDVSPIPPILSPSSRIFVELTLVTYSDATKIWNYNQFTEIILHVKTDMMQRRSIIITNSLKLSFMWLKRFTETIIRDAIPHDHRLTASGSTPCMSWCVADRSWSCSSWAADRLTLRSTRRLGCPPGRSILAIGWRTSPATRSL